MRSFIELCAKGNRRAIIDTTAILGVVMAENRKKDDIATDQYPATLILRKAEPIEIVGMEPVMIFAEMTKIALKVDEMKESGRDIPVAIQWLDMPDADE